MNTLRSWILGRLFCRNKWQPSLHAESIAHYVSLTLHHSVSTAVQESVWAQPCWSSAPWLVLLIESVAKEWASLLFFFFFCILLPGLAEYGSGNVPTDERNLIVRVYALIKLRIKRCGALCFCAKNTVCTDPAVTCLPSTPSALLIYWACPHCPGSMYKHIWTWIVSAY